MNGGRMDQKNMAWLERIGVPLIVGIVAVGGTLGGVVLTDHLAGEQSAEQARFTYAQGILNERLDLIERAAATFAQAPGIQAIWFQYTADFNLSSLPADQSQVLAAYNAEYEAVLMMASIYFGQETRTAIQTFSEDAGPWWLKRVDKADAVLIAMHSELMLGIDDLRI